VAAVAIRAANASARATGAMSCATEVSIIEIRFQSR
jgi:hypothetical protein